MISELWMNYKSSTEIFKYFSLKTLQILYLWYFSFLPIISIHIYESSNLFSFGVWSTLGVAQG